MSLGQGITLAQVAEALRGPVTDLTGFANAGLDLDLTPVQQHKILKSILTCSRELTRIQDGLSHYTDMDRQGVVLEQKTVSVAEIIWDLQEEFREAKSLSHVEFSMRIREGLPVEISTDRQRLRQAVSHLLFNALKFTPRGRVVLEVWYDKVEGSLIIEVSDTGVGIPPERLPTLFQGVWEKRQGNSDCIQQYSIGLPYIQYIVDRLGGRLTVQSRVGIGTTVRIALNIGHCRADEGFGALLIDGTELDPVAPRDSRMLSSLRGEILIGESNLLTQKLYEVYLAPTNIRVRFARDGASLLDNAMSGDFDLILTELGFLDLPGPEVVSALRTRYFLNPIVIVPYGSEGEALRRCYDCGANASIVKPLDGKRFYDLLTFYLTSYSLASLSEYNAALAPSVEVVELAHVDFGKPQIPKRVNHPMGEEPELSSKVDRIVPSVAHKKLESVNLRDEGIVPAAPVSSDPPRYALPAQLEGVAGEFVASLPEEFHRVIAALEQKDWRRVAFVSNELAGSAAFAGMRSLCDDLLKIQQSVLAQDLEDASRRVAEIGAFVSSLGGRRVEEPVQHILSSASSRVHIQSELVESAPELAPLIEEFLGELDSFLLRLKSAIESQDWDLVKSVAHEVGGAAGMYGYPDFRKLTKEIEHSALEKEVSETCVKYNELVS
ncbi:MAG: Hpt domain-containing protein, partial [Bdellovibrionales bacterium]|nr:Hpt domain-containing protein [Bdellovibrionales bacterium]